MQLAQTKRKSALHAIGVPKETESARTVLKKVTDLKQRKKVLVLVQEVEDRCKYDTDLLEKHLLKVKKKSDRRDQLSQRLLVDATKLSTHQWEHCTSRQRKLRWRGSALELGTKPSKLQAAQQEGLECYGELRRRLRSFWRRPPFFLGSMSLVKFIEAGRRGKRKRKEEKKYYLKMEACKKRRHDFLLSFWSSAKRSKRSKRRKLRYRGFGHRVRRNITLSESDALDGLDKSEREERKSERALRLYGTEKRWNILELPSVDLEEVRLVEYR